MKAAIVEKPDVLVVRDVPMPEMGDYFALCEILWGATCSGTDMHIIEGRFPFPLERIADASEAVAQRRCVKAQVQISARA